jgi:hypothetical protein
MAMAPVSTAPGSLVRKPVRLLFLFRALCMRLFYVQSIRAALWFVKHFLAILQLRTADFRQGDGGLTIWPSPWRTGHRPGGDLATKSAGRFRKLCDILSHIR